MRWTRAALLLLACESGPPTRPEEPPVALPGPTQTGGGVPSGRERGPARRPSEPDRPAPPDRGGPPVGIVRAADEAVRRGQYELAIQTARQALHRDERYVPAMVVLAKGYYHLHKHDLAAAILDIAAGVDDGAADIHYVRGFLALARDAQPSAIASFRRATELDGNHAEAWGALGAAYVRTKNYRDAVPALERAATLAPRSARVHLNLGSAYRGIGDYARAEGAYRRALEIQRGYPEAHFNLGILYLDAPQFPGMDTIGRLGAAIEQFTRYKERQSYRLAKDDPVDAYLEEARKGIERERKRVDRQRKREQEATPAPKGAAR